MIGMAVGGFFGGYLYDVSHSYAAAWLLSFGAGLISSLLAMDLLIQGETDRPALAGNVEKTPRPAQTTSP
jgi:hypothetical protein